MAVVARLIFVLFSFVSITESSDVFGLVGSSVYLDIQHTVPTFDDFLWVFNGTKSVLKYYTEGKTKKPSTAYEGRVEFNEETYSLTLKNLQKNDSGLYQAKASGTQKTVVAEYRLSVLDPVEAPVLNHQLSNDTCNITVTCRGHDFSINSSCYRKACKEKAVTSPGGITLSLSVNGSRIICNHSNPVNHKNKVLEMTELKQHCADEGGHKPSNTMLWLGIAVGSILFVIIIIITLLHCHRKRSTGPTQCENTVYAEVENNGATTPTMALESPSTVYSFVGKKPASTGQSNQTPVPENESISADITVPNTYESVPDQIQFSKPETIYAVVSKPNKAVNQAKLDEAASGVRK
ncbi:SLAM family member 9-like isoform X2 [Pygocentrus nattereri]|uniref:Immunoglobulin domain-containing protein n=1 Tax=Pygocentrus nattereri TaxID=42514 RepID=A0A3B4DIN4_PYGNA|nr:SLAM family member 9-like isoform X2 [Pygocentrus nattereri]